MDKLVHPQSEKTIHPQWANKLRSLKGSSCQSILPLCILLESHLVIHASYFENKKKKIFINIITFKLSNFQMPNFVFKCSKKFQLDFSLQRNNYAQHTGLSIGITAWNDLRNFSALSYINQSNCNCPTEKSPITNYLLCFINNRKKKQGKKDWYVHLR